MRSTSRCALEQEPHAERRASLHPGCCLGRETESVCSLGDVFGVAASTVVGTLLSLVVGVNSQDTSVVLHSLFGATNLSLFCAICLGNLGCLISDFTITGQRAVNLSHVLNNPH